MPRKSCDNKQGWSTPEEIKSILRDKWDKGVFLNGDDTGLFPLQISIKAPSAKEITENFTKAQKWVADFEAMSENDVEAVAEEIGDLLFVVSNLARHLKVDPEAALRAANGKFERRFRFIEPSVREAGRSMEACSLEELDALWGEAKKQEKQAPG